MKNQTLLNATITFFLIHNTSYFWEGKIGVFGMLTFLLLKGVFFILLFILIYQIGKLLQEKLANRQRLMLVGVMFLVLTAAFLRPNGLINFDQLEGKDVLVAQRAGGGNCLMRLKLKDNQKFIEKSFCFGVHETRGRYELKGDTVFFTNKKGNRIKDFYAFAVIQEKDTRFTNDGSVLLFFNSVEDTQPHFLLITRNEIHQKASDF